jgi:cell wall-associated NlpC family hydrolase
LKKFHGLTIILLLLVSLFASSSVALAAFGDVTMSLGSRGPDVKVLQQKLNSLGYWCTADGVFGSYTQKLVVKFQTAQGISPTGTVGKITSARLIALTTKTPTPTPTPIPTPTPAPTPVPVPDSKGTAIVNTAKQLLGVPYVWGGSSSSGFDCSGFTSYVLAKNGVSIPRTAALQFGAGTPVEKANLKIGDSVFFTTYTAGASHTGFYMGDGNFIHASSAAGKVTISSLNSTYYSAHYIGARRYL